MKKKLWKTLKIGFIQRNRIEADVDEYNNRPRNRQEREGEEIRTKVG